MSSQKLSRRTFFRQAGAGAGAALGVTSPASAPNRAWIIVAVSWEYNDEFSYAEGESPQTELYYDQATAEAECRRLCAEFYRAQTPAEFEIDWDAYFYPYEDLSTFDEQSVTWEEVRAAGFPEPYYVLELTPPGEPAP